MIEDKRQKSQDKSERISLLSPALRDWGVKIKIKDKSEPDNKNF